MANTPTIRSVVTSVQPAAYRGLHQVPNTTLLWLYQGQHPLCPSPFPHTDVTVYVCLVGRLESLVTDDRRVSRILRAMDIQR